MMRICVLILCLGIILPGNAEVGKQKKPCQCAVFDRDQLTTDAKLLLKQTLMMDLFCSDCSVCKNMCVTLALAAKNEAPKIICKAVEGDIDHIKPAVFFRESENEDWQYSGITTKYDICCRDNAPVNCEETEPTTTSSTTSEEEPQNVQTNI